MVNDKRKLPIGIQSFQSLRQDGYRYVDKTAFLYELVHTSKQFFLSRPRRFGKSLFLSTLREYWEGRRELFDGLCIVDLEAQNPDAWQPHPVFYFDFNRDNYNREGALEAVLEEHLRLWERTYDCEDTTGSLSARFQRLLVQAQTKTGRRCVVLVDEYDKSLLDAMQDSALMEHNKAVFRGFFSALKSYDQYLRFVFITGVTKFSKVSIFSDLNQLKDLSFSERYADLCGITEEELRACFAEEVRAMAGSLDMTEAECYEQLRRTYDGYRFHYKSGGVYNPFSLLNALDDREFKSYWFATGTPTFLVEQVKRSGLDVRRLTNRMLYADEGTISDYRVDNPDPVPLLYQTGYLTILEYDRRRHRYTLGLPNEEVKYGFLESLMSVYTSAGITGTGLDLFSLDECVESGDLDGMRTILTALFASIPYPSREEPFEHYFQAVIYLLFTLLGKYVRCEIHSNHGRADCIVETSDYVYLFEFKLDLPVEAALEQIDRNEYALPYSADRRTVYKVGVSFDSRQRSLADWKAVKA